MDFADNLREIRLRWWAVVAVVVFAVGGAWITSPGKAPPPKFTATAHLLVIDTKAPVILDPLNGVIAAGLARSPEVVARVAAKIGWSGEQDALRDQVKTSQPEDRDKNGFFISAVDLDAERVETLVNTYASELISWVEAREQARLTTTLDQVREQTTRLEAEQAVLEERIVNAIETKAPNGESLLAERVTVNRQLSVAVDRLTSLAAFQGERVNRVLLVAPVVAEPVDVGLNAPASRGVRTALGGTLGLMAGCALAVGLGRLDPALRSREQAEAAFGFPVISSIPEVQMIGADIRARSEPMSAVAEAYRSLATAALSMPVLHDPALPPASTNGNGHRPENVGKGAPGARRVLVVTSPGPGEGKSTTAANLATCLAQAGSRVLVLDADNRRPTVHRFLGVSQSPGMSDVLRKGINLGNILAVARDTNIPQVKIITSGESSAEPAALVAAEQEVLGICRTRVDAIVVDTPPLLVVNDVNELVSVADAVVLVCRAGLTTSRSAARAAEVLRRLRAPVVGVVMVGFDELPAGYARYYSHQRRSSATGGRGGLRTPTRP